MSKVDYSHELDFWKNHLAQKDHFKARLLKLLNPKKRKLAFPKIILKNFEGIMQNRDEIEVLDVGCGPTSGLAWAVDKKYFKVIGIDPLSKEYNKMMKDYNYIYPIIPLNGLGEKITKKFGKEKFDFVYSRNSLDHTTSPIRTFQEMVSSLKKGGFICIEFMKFEGIHAKWRGLHKWNLEIMGKDLVCFDMEGNKKILNKSFNLNFKDKLIGGKGIGDWQSILFQKVTKMGIKQS